MTVDLAQRHAAAGAPTGAPAKGTGWRRGGLAVVFLAPIAIGVFTAFELSAMWTAGAELSAGRDADKRLAALLSTLKDAESGQRGYLLTGDRAYLKPYADAIAALPKETAAVSASIAAMHSDQMDLVEQMKNLVEQKKAELAQTIALATNGQPDAAIALMRSRQGKDSMDAIRTRVTQLQVRIDDALSAAAARRRTLETSAALGLMVVLVSSFYLIVLLWQSRRTARESNERLAQEMSRRAAAETAREQAFKLEIEARRDVQEEVQRRRVAEETLTDSELNLAVTLASIGAGFIATNREGRVTRMNAVAERITGWDRADAQGHMLWDVFTRADQAVRTTFASPVELLAEQGATLAHVQPMVAVSRGGVRASLEVQSAVTRREDGSLHGAAMVFRDVTRQVQAEAESLRLAAIVESSSDAIIAKTIDGRITSWNSAAQVLFGYSAAEAIGRPVQMLMPPDRQPEEMRILADLTRGVQPPAFDTVRVAKDGSLRHVSVVVSPIRDVQGRIVGASKIARDITRQRRAEAALHASQERLRFTLDSAQIGDWDLNLASGEALCSLRHDRCFGYETPQVPWTFDTFARHVHPDDRADALLRFKAAVAGHADWHLECRVIWPDASTHWIRVHGSLLEERGVATHMLGIVTDITQQKQAEQARLKSLELELENRQFQEASRLKSQFLANMSHELRTPLNAIIGFAELLHSGAVNEDPVKRQLFLGHIGTSGRHLLQLINDVLDLSKVEAGKFEFFAEPVDLGALIGEVTDILQTSILQKKLHLSVKIAPTLREVQLDPARLKQVLYNYLSNAIKFTAAGGCISVRASAEGPMQFRIEVEDTGIGIAAADLPRLFGDFQQLDAGYTKQHQGTGLGLALTRRLVEAQGGSVGVSSTLGCGSMFHLVLDRWHGGADIDPTVQSLRLSHAAREPVPETHRV